VLMRAEDGRNACLVDLATVSGVMHVLPEQRPAHKLELDRQYVSLGPAEVDLGYAGRRPATDVVHHHLARLRLGDEIRLHGRELQTLEGHAIGRLAQKVSLDGQIQSAHVTGIMVRTKTRTDARYLDAIRTDVWEVALAEVILDPAKEKPSAR
jgi:ATP-dependent DNA helicase RecQ